VAWRSALLGASEGDMLGDALHANSVALRRTAQGGGVGVRDVGEAERGWESDGVEGH